MISTVVEDHCDEWIYHPGTFSGILPFNEMTVLADAPGQPVV